MLDDVLKTVAVQGRTVVMTSHDLSRAEDLATRFDVLSRGVIAASITRGQLKKNDLISFYKQTLLA
jgi:heme exporter protein A